MVKIAVMGYGTIGSGVVEVIDINGGRIAQNAGQEVQVKYILDLKDFPDDPHHDLFVKDIEEILNDDEVKVVVETMGGVEPAHTFVKRCLEAGKSVTTSNKALVAKHGAELLAIAKEKNINFLFEASVGGGIPIIRALTSSLTADEIEEITGILNGTTNYILTKMDVEGSRFEDVLKEAQELGYAEANPTDDVEGYDACRKIAILTSLISGKTVDFEEIYTEGITGVKPEDMKYAAAMGRTIKLLATSRKTDAGYSAMVAPFMLDSEHPLYNVHGVFNAVFVHGNVLDDAMFYGRGAGKLPTASAVVADVVDIVKNLDNNTGITFTADRLALPDVSSVKNTFFVRIEGDGEAAKKAFNVAQTVTVPGISGEVGIVTEPVTEGEFKAAVEGLDGVISSYRLA
ncbi:MAG: homoserine dehydrogenase [Eubacterium sp.]|nr:homoserine dehydrogenase [Eubacterium sp.]